MEPAFPSTLNFNLDSQPPPEAAQWYCLQTRTLREHIAAALLQERAGVEVFAPRIRYRKVTTTGAKWFVEAVFPGYFFARFRGGDEAWQVRSTAGVVRVVAFAGQPVAVPDEVISLLRQHADTDRLLPSPAVFMPGDPVVILDGPMRGLHAVVNGVLSGKERVAVLLDLLGRPLSLELPETALAARDGRMEVRRRAGAFGS